MYFVAFVSTCSSKCICPTYIFGVIFQMLKALRGDSGIVECGFVSSDVTEAKYFSTPLELGVRTSYNLCQ